MDFFAFFRHNRNKYNLKEGMNDEKICIRYVSRYCITVAALAGVATTIKKTVIDPIEEKEDMIEENRKKAMRKRIAR